MPLLARGVPPMAAPGLWQDILQFHARPTWIGFGCQRQLFGDNFADIEHISRQRLRRIGLGIQNGLPALWIPFFVQVLLEDDAESVVELLRHWLQTQDAGLDELSAQPALHHDLTTQLKIHRYPGSEALEAKEAESLGQCPAFTVAGDDLQGRAGAAKPVQIYDSFNL